MTALTGATLITARYPTRCPRCGVRIGVGGLVGRVGSRRWGCPQCASQWRSSGRLDAKKLQANDVDRPER